MASIYNRGTTQAASWWIKFSDPRTGVVHRRSLETADGYRARLLQKKLEHLLALRRPQLSDNARRLWELSSRLLNLNS